MRIWRISNYADLSGRGGMVAASRWNAINTPIVYCADHPATAMVEILFHVDAEDIPTTFQLLDIEIPEAIEFSIPELPDNWKDDETTTQQIGTDFVAAERFAVMQVPSVVVPFAKNYLLSPRVAANSGIRVVGTTVHPFDPRLLRQPRPIQS
jgi:RES domain-containing protein